MADEVDLTSACGRLRRQTYARTNTSGRLKITFVDMTYPGQCPEPPSLSPHFLLFCIIYSNKEGILHGGAKTCMLFSSSKTIFYERAERVCKIFLFLFYWKIYPNYVIIIIIIIIIIIKVY